MATEGVNNIEEWVETTNVQLNSISQNFAEMKVNTLDDTSIDLLYLLGAIDDIRNEHKLIQERYNSAAGDPVAMADNLQFQLDTLERTFELLTNSNGVQPLNDPSSPGAYGSVTPKSKK